MKALFLIEPRHSVRSGWEQEATDDPGVGGDKMSHLNYDSALSLSARKPLFFIFFLL